MNITPEELSRILRVVNGLARPLRYEVECPCGVWDSEDVGVVVRRPHKGTGRDMGKRFVVTASFVLDPKERKDEALILAKAKTAIDALSGMVLVKIHEVRRTKPIPVIEHGASA